MSSLWIYVRRTSGMTNHSLFLVVPRACSWITLWTVGYSGWNLSSRWCAVGCIRYIMVPNFTSYCHVSCHYRRLDFDNYYHQVNWYCKSNQVLLAVRKSDEKPRDFGASSNVHIANVLPRTRCWGIWRSSNFAYELPHWLDATIISFEGVGGILHS